MSAESTVDIFIVLQLQLFMQKLSRKYRYVHCFNNIISKNRFAKVPMQDLCDKIWSANIVVYKRSLMNYTSRRELDAIILERQRDSFFSHGSRKIIESHSGNNVIRI